MICSYFISLLDFVKLDIRLSNALLFLLIISITTLSLLYFIRFKRLVKIVDRIPGPKCSNFLGKILGNLELFWTLKHVEDPSHGFQILLGLTKIYQDCKSGIFRAWLGPFENMVVLFRADAVEALLSSNINIDKAREYKFLNPWLGLGLLTSTGDRWRSHRKLLTPAFHFRILENLVPIINEQQKVMIQIIDNQILKNNGIIDDIRPIITNCALDTICETAMGVTVNAQTDLDSDYVKSIRNVLLLFFERFLSPWLWNERLFNISFIGRQFKANLKPLHSFTDSVIKERKAEILRKISDNNLIVSNNIEEALNDIGTKRRLGFLDSLLIQHIQYPEELTELDIRSEVDTFMFEGHDTTASALTFTLLLIGHDFEIQAKIHEELDGIFYNDITRDITIEDLRNMKYLEQCIKESLRLYPSVPYIARQNSQSFKVEDYVIPKDTTCLVLIYSLHRDPNYFPNPEVFNPDRFGSDMNTNRHPYSFVPFSAGPRNCIGQKFALLEEKALLASILRKYRIKSLIHRNEMKLDIAAILKPNSEIKIEFQMRY